MKAIESLESPRGIALIEQSLDQVRGYWWVFLLLGVVLLTGGVVAISYPFVSSLSVVVVTGVVLIISGVFTILGAFWAGKLSSLLLQLLVGILYVVAGMAIRDTPVESVALLTLFTAAFFIVVGLFRGVVAVVERFPHWGWVLLNGVITFLLGLVIYDSYPNSAAWVIGLLVGIDLLLSGWSWIILALSLRVLPKDKAESPA